MQLQDDYFAAYRSLKLTRDASGVLVVEFHNNGGPFTFTAQDHTEFVDAFYRIAQDRANKIVILTGAGGQFITDVDWSSFGDVTDPGVWSQVHDEGLQVLENIANIRVPMIAAIEGRAHVHSDYALLASVIVAADRARSWLWIVARRSVVCRSHEIDASQGRARHAERKSRVKSAARASSLRVRRLPSARSTIGLHSLRRELVSSCLR